MDRKCGRQRAQQQNVKQMIVGGSGRFVGKKVVDIESESNSDSDDDDDNPWVTWHQ